MNIILAGPVDLLPRSELAWVRMCIHYTISCMCEQRCRLEQSAHLVLWAWRTSRCDCVDSSSQHLMVQKNLVLLGLQNPASITPSASTALFHSLPCSPSLREFDNTAGLRVRQTQRMDYPRSKPNSCELMRALWYASSLVWRHFYLDFEENKVCIDFC